MIPQRWIARSAMLLAFTAGLQADTLYLRDGSRVQGELISVQERHHRIRRAPQRYGSGRTLRFDRDEVVRIELEDTRRSSGGNDFVSGGRPSGMRERQTIVSADVAWNDTGVDVRAGQTIYFESHGPGAVGQGSPRRSGGGAQLAREPEPPDG